MSRVFIIMVFLLAQLSIMPLQADDLSGDFYYIENPDGISVTITGYRDTAPTNLVIIPDTIIGKAVTAIGNEAFQLKSIQAIQFPEGLISIGEKAFYNNLLTAVDIPSSVNIIHKEAFAKNPTSAVTLLEGLETIGIQAFFENALTSLVIPDSVTTIGEQAFYKNSINHLVLSNNLTEISVSTFQYNRLTSIEIPASVRVIKRYAFDANRIVHLEIPSTVTTIEERAFYYNSLKSIRFLGTPVLSGTDIFTNQYLNSTNESLYNWFTDEELIQDWDKTVPDPMTIYAAWERNIINFNTSGGSNVMMQVIPFGDKATEIIPPPTKTGHSFAGWYKDASLTDEWDFNVDTVIKDVMLYAKWTVNEYTVSFNSNGGTAVAAQTIAYDGTVTLPVEPSRMGYTLEGWYSDEELTTPWSFGTDLVKNPLTLYAKWDKEVYTVTFDSTGGSAMAEQEIAFEDRVVEPTKPQRSGYTFVGWFTDVGLTIGWDFTVDVVAADMTLYAKWSRIVYPTVPELEPEPELEQPIKEEEPVQEVCTTSFPDISNHWAEHAIKDIASRCIIVGFPDAKFYPNAPLLRAHVAVMFTRALELSPKIKHTSFFDVPEDSPYYRAILAVTQANIFEGTNGYFNPDQHLTRAQMAKILVKAFELPIGGQSTFPDVPSTHWAASYISTLEAHGLAFGDEGYYKPDELVTRAEFVAFMYRVLSL